MYENELYHYGVPGMKWGVRRYERSPGTNTRQGLDKYYEADRLYKRADNSYKNKKQKLKEAKKSGDALQIRKAKIQQRNARLTRYTRNQAVKRSYKDLKNQASIDRGRDLRKNSNTKSLLEVKREGAKLIASMGNLSISLAQYNKYVVPKQRTVCVNDIIGSKELTKALAYGGFGMAAVGTVASKRYNRQYKDVSNYEKWVKDQQKKKK